MSIKKVNINKFPHLPFRDKFTNSNEGNFINRTYSGSLSVCDLTVLRMDLFGAVHGISRNTDIDCILIHNL